MHHFHQWYNKGLVIFLGPNESCFADQIDGCVRIMNVSIDQLGIITPSLSECERRAVWEKQQIIITTFEILSNDLKMEFINVEAVKCLIVAEAHCAIPKNHRLGITLSQMLKTNERIRIVAFSIAPASTARAMRQLLQNLRISHVEIHDLPCNIERVLVEDSPPEISACVQYYQSIMLPILDFLRKNKMTTKYLTNIDRDEIDHMVGICGKNGYPPTNNVRLMVENFSALWAGFLVVLSDGIRAFYSYIMTNKYAQQLCEIPQLKYLLDGISLNYPQLPTIESLINPTIKVPVNVSFGNAKLKFLREQLVKHASKVGSTAKAIVVTSSEAVAHEIYVYLRMSDDSCLVPQVYLGCTKEKVYSGLKRFQNDEANVLICTQALINQFGLRRIGLVIQFDCIQPSVINFILTSRTALESKGGRVMFLITPGREENIVDNLLTRRNALAASVWNDPGVKRWLYAKNPQMIPEGLHIVPPQRQ